MFIKLRIHYFIISFLTLNAFSAEIVIKYIPADNAELKLSSLSTVVPSKLSDVIVRPLISVTVTPYNATPEFLIVT